jgi:predicted fused transcriptional regulator/phosphomethylpyrimidine kinase
MVKFTSNHHQNYLFQITKQNKTMKAVTNIKFLGSELDKHMNWKNHTVKVLPKVSSARYAVRYMYHFSSLTALKAVYFVYFHSVMEYGVIFWCN